ncbi:MAG: protein-glutamate O-methyltransferase CheR [Phycisphaerae bacterium]|nr:protein-glutamate O-methyltransferase CheR [Phycisphaerae bacterium]
MQVTAEDIKVISRLVNDLCGVVLDEGKGYLIEARLSGVAQEAGCKTFSELYTKARYDKDKTLQNAIINAITTQETLFFRDTSPFEALQHKALPELIDAKSGTAFPKRLRIWSAAASTGQEAYSIAMTLHELIPDIHSWDIKITGTDISDAAIKQASLGRYAEHEIKRGMQPQLLAKYFTHEPGAWKVKDELRALVAYRRLNLLEPFAGIGPFDIIFCRNVAIYFSVEARKSLFHRLAKELVAGGYLFVGSSESLTDLGPRFAPQHHCRAVFYQPSKQGIAAAV